MSGYLIRKKSKGNTYIYLRKSSRENGKVNHDYIYSFGKMPAALDHLYSIVNDNSPFPTALKNEGYDIQNILEWIMTLETKQTKNGRDFNLE